VCSGNRVCSRPYCPVTPRKLPQGAVSLSRAFDQWESEGDQSGELPLTEIPTNYPQRKVIWMKIRTIVADPPWNEKGGGKIKRGADKHYNLMKTDDIIELMEGWLSEYEHEEDQHMYLWVTNNYLADGLKVLEKLGYRYITNIVWAKPSFGIGRYFRGQHELCLFATKGRGFGDVRTDSNSISSLIEAPKREHSRKPEEFYSLVESRSNGPYLELFARQGRNASWTAKGNETSKFDEEE